MVFEEKWKGNNTLNSRTLKGSKSKNNGESIEFEEEKELEILLTFFSNFQARRKGGFSRPFVSYG